jgi:hypothetical protein
MGNDLKQKILVQNGILTEVDARPKPTVADCARCRLVNPLENKYCSSCGRIRRTEGRRLERTQRSKVRYATFKVVDSLENIAKYTESKDPGYAENLRWHREMMFFNKEKEERCD